MLSVEEIRDTGNALFGQGEGRESRVLKVQNNSSRMIIKQNNCAADPYRSVQLMVKNVCFG